MKRYTILAVVFALIAFSSCKKAIDSVKDRFGNTQKNVFIEHVIAQGQQSSNQNGYRPVSASALNFVVKFDNSAVYQTIDANNQGDINKLYGFSDNNEAHHINSARIGWRWYNNQLQLFAYVYNNTVQTNQFITAVQPDQEISCSIKVVGNTYQFTVNDAQVSMPRSATTAQAEGYLLYPFFGGNEMAPHDIHIWIKDL